MPARTVSTTLDSAHDETLAASGAELRFERQGSGEPLVLLHGLGSELCVWQPVLGALAEAHDVIAVDLPGFGGSRPLPDHITPTPGALAVAVAGLLDALGIADAHVAGNSLGGWVALELARAGRARTVTGLCPAGLWPAPLIRRATPAQARGNRLARRLRFVIPVLLVSGRVRRAVLTSFVAHPERVPYSAARRMIGSDARATAYEATSAAMRADNFRDAEAIGVPVTLAFGERDRLIRPARPAIEGARVVVLPDCGHIPMWDDPRLVAEVVLSTAGGGESPAWRSRPMP